MERKEDLNASSIGIFRFPKGKRGIVRIIEAAIAVMLILGFIIFIQGKQLPKLQYSSSKAPSPEA